MGLIKAVLGTFDSTMADQWKEFFVCDSLDADILVTKGHRRTGRHSSNRGDDNIITSGSVIAVADGQCMCIVDQGRMVEVAAEPGEFTYDASTESSIFAGSLGEGIKATFDTMLRRFTFGGDTGKDQRVYFFNTKEIVGNKYGTPSSVPFRVVDPRAGIDIDISIRCFGEYSYRLVNPILFYTNVCGNVADCYKREEIDSQLKTELLTALQPAFAKLSAKGIRYSELPAHAPELADALKEVLSAEWTDKRGIEIGTFGVSSAKATEEDEAMIKEMQKAAAFTDPAKAGAYIASQQGAAMTAAANNPNGSVSGFMGMGMAGAMGGVNAAQLFQMGQNNQVASAPSGWTCSCGSTGNTGKFCPKCGKGEPVAVAGWTCSCGAENQGNFCSQCGAKRPQNAPLYRCDKCGWTPTDPTNPPKYCPNCGDVFDENDIVK